LLVDQRYAQSRISGKLPKWIGEDVKVGDFGSSIRNLAAFFKGKAKKS
jgi:chromosome transmission fidelity protein 1